MKSSVRFPFALLTALLALPVAPLAAQTTLFFSNGENYGTPSDTGVNPPFTVNIASGAASHNALISGSGSLTKTGTGTLSLTVANTYEGGTFITAGTLSVASDANLGAASGALAVTSGATLSTGAHFFTNRDFTLDGAGTYFTNGNGELAIGYNGTGSLALSNNAYADTYGLTLGYTGGTGTIDISSGSTLNVNATTYINTASSTLNINTGGILATAGISNSGGTLNLAGGTLRANASFTSASNITLSNSSTVNTNGYSPTLSGILSGDGDLTKSGAGTLTLSGANTFSGATTISGGTVSIAADSGLGTAPVSPTPGHLTLAGGTLATTANFNLDANRGIALGVSGGNLNTASATGLGYGGIIAGEGALTKSGAGTLTLAGANTYTGATSVDAGTVVLGNTTTSPSFAIAAGATLELNVASGTRDNAANTTFTGTGTLAKTGDGTAVWGTTAATFDLGSGALIDVQAGTLSAGSAANEVWTNNLSDLNVASGATFTGVESNVRVDALTGAGTITTGFNGAGYTALTSGVDDGSGTFSGVIADTDGSNIGNYVKAGSGTQILTGANTYTGTTTISDGTLQIGNGSNTGSLASTAVTNNANLTFNRSDAVTYAGAIGGTGSLTKSGAGTLTLTGANTFSGETSQTAAGGTLAINHAQALQNSTLVFDSNAVVHVDSGITTLHLGGLSGSANFAMSPLDPEAEAPPISGIISGTFDLSVGANGDDTTYSGILSDSGSGIHSSSLTKVGTGTLTLSGANTYSGNTTVTGGILSISSDGNLGETDGTLTLDGGTLRTTTGLTLDSARTLEIGSSHGTFETASGTSTTFNGFLTGSGDLTKTGTGNLTLGGMNSFTGDTSITGGTITLTDSAALAGSTVTTTAGLRFNGITTAVLGNISGTDNLVLENTGGSALTLEAGGNDSSTTFGGVISGDGSLAKYGSGTLTLTRDNTYAGATTLVGGTLSIGTESALGAVPDSVTPYHLNLYGGTLATTASMTLDANRGVDLGGFSSISTAADTTLQIDGIVAGTGDLAKTGSGTLTLTATNTYSGATNVSAGTLLVTGENASIGSTSEISIGSADDATLTVADGAFVFSNSTLTLGNTSDGTGTLNITAPGTFEPFGQAVNVFSVGDTIIGHEGTGNVALSGGAVLAAGGDIRLGTGANGHATVTVSGTDGTSDFRSGLGARGALVIAEGAGSTATFTVSDGANAGADGGIEIAAGANSTGTLTVIGSDPAAGTHSELRAANVLGAPTAPPLTIALATGAGSEAFLNISNGGEVILTDINTDTESVDALTKGLGDATVTLANGTLSTTAGGTLTSAVAITTAGSNTLNTDTGTIALGGVISGTGALTKTGSGTLTLSAANTFSGDTTISEGTLTLAHTNALQNSTLTTATGLDFGNLTTATLGGLSGSQNLTLTNTAEDPADVALTVGGNDADTEYSGKLSGGGSLTKTGIGNLTLSGDNDFAGSTTVNAGTLTIADDSALGTAPGSPTPGHLTLDGGTLATTVTFALAANRGLTIGASGGTLEATSPTTFTINGEISGNGNLGIDGEGNVTLARSNSFSGTTTLLDADATLTLGHAQALQYSTVTTTGGLRFGDLASATLGGIAGTQDLALTSTSLDPFALTVGNNSPTTTHSGIISGSGSLILTGGQLTLAGANTFTGETRISSNGTLILGHEYALQNSTLTPDGGTLSFGALENVNVRALAGSATLTLASTSLNPFSLSVGGDGAYDSTFNGSLEGSGNLIKTGTGTLTLNGSNSNFDGTATLAGGTLALGDNNGSALEYATLLTVADGGTIDFGLNNDVTLGGLAGDGDLALPGMFTLTVGNNSPTTYSGSLSGTGSLRLTGGQLTLAGPNTFSGTTDLQSGTLVLGHSQALQSSVLRHDNSANLSFGDLSVVTLGGLDGSSSIALGNVALTLDVASGGFDDPDFGGELSGSGSLTKTGAGTQILSGTNTFTGTTTVSAGTLRLTNENALQYSTLVTTTTGTVDLSSLTDLNLGGLAGDGNLAASFFDLSLNVGSNNTETTYSGVLSGNVDLTKSGSSILTLTGANTFSGEIAVTEGVLALDHTLAAQNAVISVDSGAYFRFQSIPAATIGGLSGSHDLDLTNEGYAAVALTLNVASGTGENDPDFSGVLTGSGSITKTGAGTQTLSGNNSYSDGTTVQAGTLVLSGANTGDGDTTVTGGTLRLTHSDALQNSTLVTSSDGGSVDFDSLTSVNLGGLQGSGNLSAGMSSRTFSVGANNQDTTYSGVLSNGDLMNTLSLTKTGSGTLTLANANTFSGETSITNGTLALAHTQALQNSVLTSIDGLDFGTLTAASLGGLDGSGSLALTNSDEPSAAVALTLNVATGTGEDDPDFSGTLTGTGTLTKTGAGTQILSAANTFTGDTTVSGGTLRLTHADALQNSTLVTFSGDGSVDFDSLTSVNLGGLQGSGNLSAGSSELTLSVGANGDDTTYSGVLADGEFNDLYLAKTGTGSLTLSNANTFTGDTAVNGGTLVLAHQNALQSSSVLVNQGTLTFDGIATATIGALDGDSSGSLILQNTADTTVVLTVGGNDESSTFSGEISGSGSLIKTGTNSLTLDNSNNSYAGSTTITDGSLEIGDDSHLGSAPESATPAHLVLDGGTLATTDSFELDANRGIALGAAGGTLETVSITELTYDGIIAGSGDLIKSGEGSLNLGGANTFTGSTTVLSGQLNIGASGSLTGDLNLDGGYLSLANSTGLQTSAVHLSDESGGIDFDGINAAQFGGLTGDGELYLSSSEGALALAVGANNLDTTFSGVISGQGSLIKTGTGTLTLQGTSDYDGTTTVSAGTLAFNNKEAFYESETDEVLDSSNAERLAVAAGATATFYVDTTVTDSVVPESAQFTEVDIIALLTHADFDDGAILGINTTDAIGGEVTFSELNYDGALGLTKSGTGDLVLETELGFTGPTSITGGRLVLADEYALQDSTVTTTAGLAFDYDSITLGGISGSQSLSLNDLDNNEVDLTVGYNNSDTDFSGEISGDGSLEKVGSGVLTLSGANTYTGDTTISEGTLALGHDNALASTASVEIASGATLDLNDHSVTITDLNGAGDIDLGSANLTTGDTEDHQLAGTISGSGSLTKAGTGTVTLGGTNTYEGGTFITAGTLAATDATQFGTGALTVNTGATVTVADPTAFNQNITLDGPGATFAASTAGGDPFNPATYTQFTAVGAPTTLTVNNGATLTGANLGFGAFADEAFIGIVQSGGSVTGEGAVVVGGFASAATQLTVTGANSFLSSSAIIVGAANTGTATLTVANGAGIGSFSTSLGYGGGDGFLHIADGGTFITSYLDLAGASADVASVQVDTGGILQINEFENGEGAISLSGTDGALRLNGGTLQAGTADDLIVGAFTELGTSTTSIADTNGVDKYLVFAAPVSGAGNLQVTGGGVVVVTYASSFTGQVQIQNGAFALDGDGSIANSSGIDLGDAGVFDLTFRNSGLTFGPGQILSGSGTVTVATDQTLTLAGTFAPGNSPGLITVDGNLTLLGGAILDFELGSNSDRIDITGGLLTGPATGLVTLNLFDAGDFNPAADGTYTLFNFVNGGTADFDLADFTFGTLISGTTAADYTFGFTATSFTLTYTASAIPEPSTYAILFGATILGFTAWRKRRRP